MAGGGAARTWQRRGIARLGRACPCVCLTRSPSRQSATQSRIAVCVFAPECEAVQDKSRGGGREGTRRRRRGRREAGLITIYYKYSSLPSHYPVSLSALLSALHRPLACRLSLACCLRKRGERGDSRDCCSLASPSTRLDSTLALCSSLLASTPCTLAPLKSLRH